jgi:hypothetical protein
MLVLDSGGFTKLSTRSTQSLALIREFVSCGLWPPVVPTPVLIESLHGHAGRDASANRFLKVCVSETVFSVALARRAAELRRRARAGSAIDALVVAVAEPGGTVLTGDSADITTLAGHADDVAVEVI